jgi:16S rRNA (adenine1518-N6/adenine1519-N6)-dimethyltransferase
MQKISSLYRHKYGQHFLNSQSIARRITDFADVDGEVVLEIGAGKGMLTKQLAKRAQIVYAVEIDKNMVEVLNDLTLDNVEVVHNDFRTLTMSRFNNPVLVGNIPYSITTDIINILMEQLQHFKRAVLMVQKEFGDKMRARAGTPCHCALSACIQYCFSVEKGFSVPPRFFSPRPRVSSMVVSLRQKKTLFTVDDKKKFFAFIQGLFRYKRKSLRNALKHYTGNVPDGIDPGLLQKRPADVSLRELYCMYEVCKQ